MIFRKYLLWTLILVTLVWAIYMIIPSYRDYCVVKETLHKVDKQLLKQDKENEILRIRNNKLQIDPKAIERVAREKFGWSRVGEKIYDFSGQID